MYFTTCSTDVLQLCVSPNAVQTYYNYVFHQIQHRHTTALYFTQCSIYYIYVFHQMQHRHTTVMCFPKCSTNITHNIYVFHQMQHRHTLVMSFTRCCTHILCAHHWHTEHRYCVLTTDIQNTDTVCSPLTYRTHILCAHHWHTEHTYYPQSMSMVLTLRSPGRMRTVEWGFRNGGKRVRVITWK